jgi:LAS superfamily LD-carboxypeptidase LdcB
MNRKTFLTTSVFGLLGTGLLAQIKNQNNYSKDQLIGKGVPKLYSEEIPLLTPVAESFLRMQRKAQQEGITIEIVSAYRSYKRQKGIWNRKFIRNAQKGLIPKNNVKKIIEYSTLPGTSRHHWGTDVDIIDGSKPKEGDVLVTEKFHNHGPYESLRVWMDKNAHNFGFIRPYTNDPKRKGFYYEPWHYSYAPISKAMLQDYLNLDLKKVLVTKDLEGKEALTSSFLSDYLDQHVLGIHPDLR